MQLRPVIQADAPHYPTREAFRAEAGQLFEHLPPRWRKVNGLLGAAAAVLAAQLGGCSTPVEHPELPAPASTSSPLLVQNAADWTENIFRPQVFFPGSIIITQPQGPVHVEDVKNTLPKEH